MMSFFEVKKKDLDKEYTLCRGHKTNPPTFKEIFDNTRTERTKSCFLLRTDFSALLLNWDSKEGICTKERWGYRQLRE